VARVEAVSDAVTEERVAMVAFEQLPGAVSIGELTEVTVSLAPAAPALVLPNASIKRQGETTGVWRVQDGRLGFAPVRLGQSSLDGQVQVLEGLQAGDAVVVFSQKELSERSRIKVVDELVGRAP
jgi:HlyD family secretion protein